MCACRPWCPRAGCRCLCHDVSRRDAYTPKHRADRVVDSCAFFPNQPCTWPGGHAIGAKHREMAGGVR